MSEQHEFEHYEVQYMPSINHSFIQGRITGLFFVNDRFTPFIELSLDASQIELSQFGIKAKDELIPDVCLYEGVHKFRPTDDASKRSDMPVLVIEVLSPTQGANELLAKFKAYFALGVKSCWLIIPTNEAISVYSTPNDFKTFGTQDTEIVDEVLNIRLSTQQVWG